MKINVQKLYGLDGHQDCVYTLVEGLPENIIYSAGGDGMVVEWDLNDPEIGNLLVRMNNSVYAIHYRQAEQKMIVGENFNGIHIIDINNKKESGSLKISNAQIFDIKSYKQKIFVGSADGTLYVVDLRTMSFIKKVKLGDKSVRSIAVNSKLGEIALGLSDNTIRILDMDNYKQKYLIEAHALSVFAVDYSPENNHLISVGRDAHLKSWNSLNHYVPEQSVVAHMYAINSVSLSPDNRFMVTGSMDKSIKVWDLNEFKLLKVIDNSRYAGHGSSVNKVLWTKYKNQFISCSDDKKISVWDLEFKN